MNDNETNFIYSDSPFVAIALASFDSQKNVSIIEKWFYGQDKKEILLEPLLRLNFYSPSSEKDNSLKTILFRHVDCYENKLSSYSSIFQIKVGENNNIYTLSIIYQTQNLTITPEIETLIKYCLRQITHSARYALKFQQPMQSINPLMSRTLESLIKFVSCHVFKAPSLEKLPADLLFYMNVLTSHFETQMCTVIETSDYFQAKSLAYFLANFTVLVKLYHSSLDFMKRPIPGLYLQVVQVQNQSPEDILISFPFPCTWVRMSDKTVFQTPHYDEQTSISGDYNSLSSMVTDDPERERLIGVCKKKYKLSVKTNPAPWVMATVLMVSQSEESIRQRLCQLRLSHLIDIARTTVDITNEWVGEASFIIFEKVRDLWEMLGLTGKDDMYMVASVAQMLDTTIQGKLFTNRRVMLTQISTV